MGLFKKKNKGNKELDDAFEGEGIIEGTQGPKKESRSKTIKRIKEGELRQGKNLAIAEELTKLYKEIFVDPDCTCADDLRDAINLLKKLPDNPDNEMIAESVSRFIGIQSREARDSLHRKNYLALENVIFQIVAKVNDLYEGGDYYTNPQYIKFTRSERALEKEKQAKMAEQNKLEEQYKRLQAMAQDPNRKISMVQIKDQAESLIQRKKGLEKIVNNYNLRLRNIRAAIIAFEQRAVTEHHAPTTEEFEGAIDAVNQTDIELSEQSSLEEKVQGGGVNYSSASLKMDENISPMNQDNGTFNLPDWNNT